MLAAATILSGLVVATIPFRDYLPYWWEDVIKGYAVIAGLALVVTVIWRSAP